MYTISFPYQKLTIQAEEGTTLLEAEIAAGLSPDAPCGGKGLCGKCTAEILTEDGVWKQVLACRTVIDRDLTVRTDAGDSADNNHVQILTESTMSAQIDPDADQRASAASRQVSVGDEQASADGLKASAGDQYGPAAAIHRNPAIKAVNLQVERPSSSHPVSDWERLKSAVLAAGGPELCPDPVMADGLQKKLEALDYAPQAVLYHDELLALRRPGRLLTAAVDIGTTTVVLYLADQEDGKLLSSSSMLNPQTRYGADVISRANYAMEHSVTELSSCVRRAVNELLFEALKKADASAEDVFSVVIVGNTCMHHLFLGLDPTGLVLAPYVPAISEPLVLDASSYGLHTNAGAKLFMLPCIAGFVGADTSSVMLACDFDRREELTLAIDIGTNGELVLGNRHRTVACSTAAGPAFEGAKITFGMRGQEGAIDHARIENGVFTYTVIGGGKPRGLCGSGLLDLTAALLEAGVLDETGRLAEPDELPPESRALGDRIRNLDGQRCFAIYETTKAGKENCSSAERNKYSDKTEQGNGSVNGQIVYLSQKDIREVQLAKGAMAAGIGLLTKHYGCRESDIQKVLIAGAFGSYMSPESACAIGLIPTSLLSRVEQVGNAAGSGALKAALSESAFNRATAMVSRTEFVELAADPDFQDRFVDELYFPDL